jgi:putative Flp pilus-assembly TadE/G-like protein
MRSRIRARDDRGFFAAWTAIMTVVFWALMLFLTDAGKVLREHSDAFGVASAAARAGAAAIDEDHAVLTGELRLDEAEVPNRVREYMQDLDDPRFTEWRIVDVTGLEVTVEIEGNAELRMMPGSVHYVVEATVRAVQSGGGAAGGGPPP